MLLPAVTQCGRVQDVAAVGGSVAHPEACEEQEDGGCALHDGRAHGLDGPLQKHILHQLQLCRYSQ